MATEFILRRQGNSRREHGRTGKHRVVLRQFVGLVYV